MRDWQAQPPAACCAGCGGEIYRGETAYEDWDGDLLHPDCLLTALSRRVPLKTAAVADICGHCGGAVLPGEEIRRPFGQTLHDDCLFPWCALHTMEFKLEPEPEGEHDHE